MNIKQQLLRDEEQTIEKQSEEAIESPKNNNDLPPYDQSKTWIGYVFTMFAVMNLCVQQLLGKIIFERQPSIQASQLLFLRGLISSIMFIILMNRNIKQHLTVPRKHIGSLVIRVFYGVIGFVLVYTAIKYLPLVIVALVQNLTPLATAVFSYFLLKVALSPLDISVLLLSFGGIIVLITGSVGNDMSTKEQQQMTLTDSAISENRQNQIISLILLLFVPFIFAHSTIQNRKMKELSEYTIGSYLAFALTIGYTPYIYFTGQGFGFLAIMNLFDWLFFILLGFSSTTLIILRLKAIKYEEPAKTSVLNYFQSVIQFFFDIFLIGSPFNYQQLVGIAIVFFANSIKWTVSLRNVCVKKKKQNLLIPSK